MCDPGKLDTAWWRVVYFGFCSLSIQIKRHFSRVKSKWLRFWPNELKPFDGQDKLVLEIDQLLLFKGRSINLNVKIRSTLCSNNTRGQIISYHNVKIPFALKGTITLHKDDHILRKIINSPSTMMIFFKGKRRTDLTPSKHSITKGTTESWTKR